MAHLRAICSTDVLRRLLHRVFSELTGTVIEWPMGSSPRGAPTTRRCGPIRPSRPGAGSSSRARRLFVDRGYAGRRSPRSPSTRGSLPRPSISPSAASAACSKGSWTSPAPTTRAPTTTVVAHGRSDCPTPPSGWRRWSSSAAGSWPAPSRSTPSSAAPPTRKPFAADLGRRLLTERLANQTERIRRYLGDDLRPGLSVAEAGQRYCALASPELYHLLTVELAWTAEQHRSWLTQLLHTELLGSPTEHRDQRTQRQPNPRRR